MCGQEAPHQRDAPTATAPAAQSGLASRRLTPRLAEDYRRGSHPMVKPEGAAMNKGGLVAEVSKRTGLSKADAGRAVDAAIDSIRESVVRGDRVTLADFGTFERKHRNERIARNPRRPQIPIVVPARDLPAFTPGKEFREQVVTTSSNGRPE
jgi:DNA-binding protein HU-beta